MSIDEVAARTRRNTTNLTYDDRRQAALRLHVNVIFDCVVDGMRTAELLRRVEIICEMDGFQYHFI